MAKRRWLSRESVVAAAAQLADAAGHTDDLTLTALAAALDIRVPSLYNHIASLDDLHHALAVYGLQMLVARLRGAAVGRTGRQALLAMSAEYRRFAHDHPGLYPLTIRAPDPEATERTALSQELVELLLLIFASVGLHGEDALHAVRGYRAALHGFVSLEAAEGFKLALDRDESFQRLVTTLLNGLAGERS